MTRDELISKYWYELNICFHDLFRNIKLDKENIRGIDRSLYHKNSYMTLMLFNGRFNINNEELNNDIYCSVLEKNDYYTSHKRRYIFLNYKDKVYMMIPGSCDYDMNLGNYTLWCDVYVYDNKIFNLSFNSIELYHEGRHPNKEELCKVEKKSYQITLNNSTNLVTEVLSRMRKEDRSRTNKK